MSQFDKDDVEESGLLKLDVLGVRMQSALAYALAEIERDRRVGGPARRRPRRQYVPQTTGDVRLICSGRTLGCFQIESPGQRELVAKLEPARCTT